jgi:hypothetical protein
MDLGTNRGEKAVSRSPPFAGLAIGIDYIASTDKFQAGLQERL